MARAVVVALALATQTLGLRRSANREDVNESESSTTDWSEYNNTLDNGVNAILAVEAGNLDDESLEEVRTIVEAAVPFMPPPAGMAVGGALSVMSGLFGWDRNPPDMKTLSRKLEAGFALMTSKLDAISSKLDKMSEAIGRIEALTQSILDTVQDIKHMLDMQSVKNMHAEYKYMLTRMRTANAKPESRAHIMTDLINHIKIRAPNLKVKLEANFTKSKVQTIVEGVYNRNGRAGKCQARELLDDIVSVRFEAYSLLMLSAIDPATGEAKSYDLWEFTNRLKHDIQNYAEIRKAFQARNDLPWDWATPVINARMFACPATTTVGRRDSRSFYTAQSICARNMNCVGYMTRLSAEFDRRFGYPIYIGDRSMSTYYGMGSCWEVSGKNCSGYRQFPQLSCFKARAKIYDKCWMQ